MSIALDDALAHFAQSIGSGSDPSPSIPLASRTSYIEYSEANSEFQAPSLQIKTWSSHAGIVLITAGAAVGKTTLARQMSHRLGSVYIDLAQINVGAQTFQGLLLSAFGPSRIGQVIGRLNKHGMSLVLDALDEAQARAGDENFLAFLEDVQNVIPTRSEKPVLIMLGRGETVDRVSAFLGDNQIEYIELEVSYFNEASSLEFLSKYLDYLHNYSPDAPHRVYRPAFDAAKRSLVDYIKSEIRSAGWDESVSTSFLGYAPALQGVAEFLNVDNFAEIVNHFTLPDNVGRAAERVSPWAILPIIIHRLLEREQAKFIAAAQANFGDLAKAVEFNEWDAVYAPSQQIEDVAALVLGSGHIPDPSRLPKELLSSYRALSSWMIPQHPFVGRNGDYVSVLFAEYIRAHMIVARKSLQQPAFAEGTVAAHLSASYSPSPLLGHLAMLVQSLHPPTSLINPDSPEVDEAPAIAAEHLGLFYEALLAIPEADTSFSVTQIGTRGHHIGAAGIEPLGIHYAFRVLPNGADLKFRRALRCADIRTESGVHLGSSTATFRLGPDVSVVAGWIILDSRQVEVRPGAGVSINAEIMEDARRTKLTVFEPQQLFQCNWDDISFPWKQYATPPIAQTSDGEASQIEEVRSLLSWTIRLFSGRENAQFFSGWTFGGSDYRTINSMVLTLVEMRLAEFRGGGAIPYLLLNRFRQRGWDLGIIRESPRSAAAQELLTVMATEITAQMKN